MQRKSNYPMSHEDLAILTDVFMLSLIPFLLNCCYRLATTIHFPRSPLRAQGITKTTASICHQEQMLPK